MEFRLLAPFAPAHDGRPIDLRLRRQERCLLAILLLDAGNVVTSGRIADLLWNGSVPESSRRTVHTYIGRLRAALRPHGLEITTHADGYRLEPADHTIDVLTFTDLARQAAKIQQPSERLRLLDQALGLWNEPILFDFDDNVRDRLGAGLRDLRMTCVELRAESQLELGRHDQVVDELSELAPTAPTRERLTALLMTALYRAGRQADALEMFRTTRDVLVNDLGVEPGAELATLQQRILTGDQALARPDVPEYVVRVRGRYLPWPVGGHPALDFCNTYAGWHHDPPLPRGEWLQDYAAFATLAGFMDWASDHVVDDLLRLAERTPDDAETVRLRALDLRGQLYTYLTKPDATRAFDAISAHARAAAASLEFTRGDDGLGRWTVSDDVGLALPLHAAATAAADLIADPRHFSVRACPGSDCGWLFNDQAGRRRWCSMATCGHSEVCG